MRRFIAVFYLLALAFVLMGCSPSYPSEKNEKFSNLYPGVKMNQDLRLLFINTSLKDVNSGKIGDSIVLKINNLSKDQVLTHFDYGTKILWFDPAINEWKTVKNLSEYGDEQDIIIPPTVDSEPVEFFGVWPELSSSLEKINLRVVVTGVIYRNNTPTHEKVGAYIDFELVKK